MDKKEIKEISLKIWDKYYFLKVDEDEEYTKKIAEYLSNEMKEIAKYASNEPYEKIAVIAALNITDKLFKEKEKNKEIESKLNNLLNKVQ